MTAENEYDFFDYKSMSNIINCEVKHAVVSENSDTVECTFNQIHPEKGVYIGTNDYNNLKTLISMGKLKDIKNKYLHKSVSQNKAIINTNTTKKKSKIK